MVGTCAAAIILGQGKYGLWGGEPDTTRLSDGDGSMKTAHVGNEGGDACEAKVRVRAALRSYEEILPLI